MPTRRDPVCDGHGERWLGLRHRPGRPGPRVGSGLSEPAVHGDRALPHQRHAGLGAHDVCLGARRGDPARCPGRPVCSGPIAAGAAGPFGRRNFHGQLPAGGRRGRHAHQRHEAVGGDYQLGRHLRSRRSRSRTRSVRRKPQRRSPSMSPRRWRCPESPWPLPRAPSSCTEPTFRSPGI